MTGIGIMPKHCSFWATWERSLRDPFDLARAVVPAAYSQLLLEVLEGRGLSADEVLRDARVPAKQAIASDTRLTIRQWSRVILSALSLSQDAGLGCEYGLRMRLTVHGVMGYALLSAPTLGDAVALLARFFVMRVRSYSLRVTEEGDRVALTLVERYPIVGLPPDQALQLRRFVHEALMLGALTGCRFILGRSLTEPELMVEWQCPEYFDRYKDRLPVVHFNQSATQLRFRRQDLDEPLLTADPIAYQQAWKQCEHEWFHFGEDETDVAEQVRTALVLVPGTGYPSRSQIAKSLGYSERTMTRRLQAHGMAFHDLLNDARQADANRLLSTTDKDIQEIADWLGYATPTNFARAFRQRWGMTPSQYRESITPRDDSTSKSPDK